MKIAIAGATGSLGRELIPILFASGHELVLLGRDKANLVELFPNFECHDLGSTNLLFDVDRLINLAARNNDLDGDLAAFKAANEQLALELATKADQANIQEYVFVSSVHALDPNNLSHYAVSKRLGHRAVLDFARNAKLNSLTIYLGAVTTNQLHGKLAPLNYFPQSLRRPMLDLLRCVRPTTRTSSLARSLGDPKLLINNPSGEIISTHGQEDNSVYKFILRFLELVASVLILPIAIVVSLIITALIRVDSKGPAIFCQKRVGQFGRTFTCYKFRTMHLQTPQAATHQVSRKAVTRVGNFLRHTKLDELPQIFNIILGQMSFVGPRPCLPNQKELIEERSKRGVLSAKPGITGLSQINGIDMSDPELLARWDEKYLALRTLPLEIIIIIKTMIGSGRGDRTKN